MRILFGSPLIFLALLVSAAVARSTDPPGPEATVALARSGAADCLPNCVEWIAFDGMFYKHTPKQFREALARARSPRPPILISSGGGDADAAMAIGRLVRARRLDVVVARTEAPGAGAAPAADKRAAARAAPVLSGAHPVVRDAYCASACTFLLAAGKRRVVPRGAKVGVHEMLVPEQDQVQRVRYYQTQTLTRGGRVVSRETRITGERSFNRHVERHAAHARDYSPVLAYLKEMGLPSAEILRLMKTAAPENISWLSRADLEQTTKLATESVTPLAFLGLEEEKPAEAARPAPSPLGKSGSDVSRVERAFGRGVSPGQILALAFVVLAMGAAIAASVRRGARLNASKIERRDPPSLDL